MGVIYAAKRHAPIKTLITFKQYEFFVDGVSHRGKEGKRMRLRVNWRLERTEMKLMLFKVELLHCKAILVRGQPGLMK